jgi:hypothetical protein
MKKSIILMLLCAAMISIFACKKESISSTNQEAITRVIFKDFEAFTQTFDEISKLASKEEMDKWSKSKGFSNLLNSEEEELQTLPYAFLAILNKNAEFEMNDSIIWYHSGNLYRFAKQDEDAIPSLKKSPEQCQIAGSVRTQLVKSVEDRTTQIDIGKLNANNQHQFTQVNYQPCGGNFTGIGGVRKYVHEVYSTEMANGDQTIHKLFLRLKLEYRTSKNNWRAAGEQRAMTIDVSGNANVCSTPVLFTINQSFSCSNNVDLLLAQQVCGSVEFWTLNMTGTITHRVMGDVASNTWVNSGNLW